MSHENLEQLKLDLETQRAIIENKRVAGRRVSRVDSLRNQIASARYFNALTEQATVAPWRLGNIQNTGLYIAGLEIELTALQALRRRYG